MTTIKKTKSIANDSVTTHQYSQLHPDQISLSPLNYRKLIAQKDLESFAEEISLHGIISPITVRPLSTEKYELVAGERRLRAARMAGLDSVPAIVKIYTDEEVREIQLAENLQRENPHPLHEAFAIGQLQQAGKKIDEIATRLGKSKQLVYTRIKLLHLIEPIQEMFVNDMLQFQEALAIASVSAESQTDFFKTHCSDWKTRKNFNLYGVEDKLDQFRYDLAKALFNPRDKKLLPEAGACTNCPSNTATLKSLFPEYAKQAICNNRECYHKKSNAWLSILFVNTYTEHQPEAIIVNSEPSAMITALLQSVEGAADLPVYNRYDINITAAPDTPDREDYTDEDAADGVDEAGYSAAMKEYKEEMEEYRQSLESGRLRKGLLLTENKIAAVVFNPEKQDRQKPARSTTAKELQAAIKSGEVTVELLQSAIDSIHTKEIRAKELDREKVQLAIHEQFSQQTAQGFSDTILTNADLTAARLLIYQSLDYHTRNRVNTILFPEDDGNTTDHQRQWYDQLTALSDNQYSFLIRSALACSADSKQPLQASGYFLYRSAQEALINVEAIEQAQEQKVAARLERQEEKITALEKKILQLNPQI